jgi:hypothetical protein
MDIEAETSKKRKKKKKTDMNSDWLYQQGCSVAEGVQATKLERASGRHKCRMRFFAMSSRVAAVSVVAAFSSYDRQSV